MIEEEIFMVGDFFLHYCQTSKTAEWREKYTNDSI